MSNDKWKMLFTACDYSDILSGVAFILFDLREYPVEFARSDFPTTKFTDARGVYFQRRATIRAIQVSAGRRRLGFAVANEGPVFTPLTQVLVLAGDHSACLIDCVVVALGEDPERDRIVKCIDFDFGRLHRQHLTLIESVSQPLPFVGV